MLKKLFFIPRKSGRFKFAIESVNEQNRFAGPVLLTFNGDTAIHYNTTWVPDFHSGEIELEKGENMKCSLRIQTQRVPYLPKFCIMIRIVISLLFVAVMEMG